MRKLAKRMLSFILSLWMLLGMIPSFVFAENSASAQADKVQTIEQQIIAYANSINFADADDGAAWELSKHGITGGGRQMNVGGSNALTVTLMNSKLAQTSIIRGCTLGIEEMQRLGLSSSFVNGGCNWNSQGMSYRTVGYPNDSALSKQQIFSRKTEDYTGKTNGYDDALIWMTGSTSVHIYITRKAVSADTVTYDVKVLFKDRFDFNKGNHTVPEQFASLLGSALFREFDWTATAKFQLSVPNECTHRGYNYHLTYDPEEKRLVSHESDVFEKNNPEQTVYHATTKDVTYYRLEQMIHLRHDRPWVLEYTVTKPNAIAFSEVEMGSKDYTNLLNSSRSYLFFVLQKDVDTDAPYTAYCGVRPSKLFKYNTTDSYTLQFENVLNSDKTNTIYLTVRNNTKEQVVLEPMAMDDYYLRVDGAYVLQDDQSLELSGRDLAIGYLGNRSYNFDPPAFEMKVWENGIGETPVEFFKAKTVKPTCTAKGYTQYTCDLCGYAYKTQYVNAKGHVFGQWEESQKTDCTNDGMLQRQCSVCKESQTQTLPALGHSVVADPATSPSCTQTGLTAGEHCAVCEDILVPQTQIPALGHDMGDWVVLKSVTCTEDGEQQRSCNRCDYVEIQVLKAPGHTVVTDGGKAPTCTQAGWTEGSHCQSCNEIFQPQQTLAALGHALGQWSVSEAESCIADGQRQRACSRCDYMERETIKATGHFSVTDEEQAPTCTQIGLTAGAHCAQCGEILTPQQQLPALGHDMGEWVVLKRVSCTVDGEQQRSCSRCSYVETQTLKAPGHTVVTDEKKLPTCTQTGLTEGSHCQGCDAIFIPQQTVAALGHQMGEWEVCKAESCTVDGEEMQRCIRCEYTRVQVRKATGHAYKTVVVFATCTDNGYTSHTCLCGDAYYDGYVDPTGHHYLSVVVAPTYTEAGYTEYSCNLCGDSRRDSYTDALGLPVPDVVKPTNDPVSGGMYLSWMGCDQADGYEIYRATKKTGKYTKIAFAESEQWLDTAVSVGKTYYYKIKAVSLEDSSLGSGYSGIVSATAKCAKPALSANAGSTGKPVLSWKKISGAKKYEIWRSSNGGSFKKLTTTTKTTYTDKKAKLGTQYTYKIKAVGAKSSYSSVFSETISCYATCAAPSVKIKVDTTTGRPVLSWKKITGAAGYEIYRDGQLLAAVSGVSYTDATAGIGSKHSYQVVALGKTAQLHSLQSKTVSAVAVCAKPKLTGRIGDSNKPELTWGQVEGAVGYAVYRSTSKTKGYKKIGEAEDIVYTDLTAKKNKTYYYKIVALADNGNSTYSSYVKLKSK